MAGRRLSSTAAARPPLVPLAGPGPIVGGVDPGTRQVGYAVLALDAAGWQVLACGSIACGRGPMAGRLARILNGLEAIFAEHRPTVVGIETTYFGRSPAAAIKMGQGRGVALAAAARAGAEVLELAPRAIKQAVTGFGGADKDQVADLATRLLGLARPPQSRDASDALGCALAVALQLHRGALLAAAAPRAPRAAEPAAPANRASPAGSSAPASRAARPGRRLRGPAAG